MNWLKVKVRINKFAAEAIANLLLEIGSEGIEEKEINNDSIELSGYYKESEKDSVLIKIDEGITNLNKFIDCSDYLVELEYIKDSDWENSWKEHFKPFYLIEGVLIKPSWVDIDNDLDIIIEMDPGMAFGTGLHETTKLCSLLLKNNIKKNDRVIDLGCGTGVLSILASKLGAKSIRAVDIDKIAVLITERNFKINKIKIDYEIYEGDIDILNDNKADIFVCNIVADVLIAKAEFIKNYIENNSILILSGIIKDRAKEVLEKYNSLGYVAFDKKELGEWVAYSFKCTDL